MSTLASEPMNGTYNSQRFVTLAYWIKIAFQRKQLTMSELIKCRKREASCGGLNKNDPHRLINWDAWSPIGRCFWEWWPCWRRYITGFQKPTPLSAPLMLVDQIKALSFVSSTFLLADTMVKGSSSETASPR